jgi:hypothetical protein
MARKTPGKPRGQGGNGQIPESNLELKRELIMVAKQEVGMRARRDGLASTVSADLGDLDTLLKAAGAVCHPLFGDSEERVLESMTAMPAAEGPETELPDLSLYYLVEAPDEQLDDLCAKICETAAVETAYVKPPAHPAAEAAPVLREAPVLEGGAINEMLPTGIEGLPATANYTSRQGYLGPAVAGIDAHYAWTLPGGRGYNVRICDVEGGWNFAHEDLRVSQGGVIGTNSTSSGWRNHGTAVVGEIGGDRNTIGITGICPDAYVRGVSIFPNGTSWALRTAADRLRPGDIILIELQRGGPKGWIPIEWWPDDYAAIRYAVNKGIVVVEAAGNGNQNLDDPIYDARPSGFPADWKNPFDRRLRDSGAVLVGAGAPPPGTNGRNHGPDRSRLGFSNYGSAVDVQGWGREVVTTGYGDLQGGTNPDLHYTERFSGTSSASPIVVGALGCTQGVLRARRRPPLSPARARDLLRASGSPQQDAPTRPRTQRIGRRPNLRRLIPQALYVKEWIGVQFVGTVPGNSTRRWFTHNWPAHWHMQWNVVPTKPRRGGPQIDWNVQVERASDRRITYWITVKNLTPDEAKIEGRYAVLGW